MVIETEHLLLREWKKEDAKELANGLNDFDVAKNLTVPFPYELEYANEYIERQISGSGSLGFAIVLKENDAVIGGTSIKIEADKNSGGIWLNKNYHGKGYGTEAWVARAKFMFLELGTSVVQSGFFEHNKISGKMQQKIGGKVVGKKMNFCPALNSDVTEILIELKKSDFENYLFSCGDKL